MPNKGKPVRAKSKPRHASNRKKNKRVSSINPDSLIRKASPAKPEEVTLHREVKSLPLDHRLIRNITHKGFKQLTQIQDGSLEFQLEGKDVLGIAKTGTGKTGAFLIPLIQRLLVENKNRKTLILVPTRELAVQVEEEFNSLAKKLPMRAICVIGGTSVNRDIQRLRERPQLVIGTPGRVQDLIVRKALRLKSYNGLILDEFDRMLDMGFVKEVMGIARGMVHRDQTVLFSATVNDKQKPSIDELLKNPEMVRTTSGKETSDHIEQQVIRIKPNENKFSVLLNLIQQDEYEKVLVFAETKSWVKRITSKLRKSGIDVDEIHGNKTQNYRIRALNKFRRGELQVLAATDVAARGIDVDDVTHVINYQMPMDMDSYIHRIGRTGRAGKQGKAVTLVD
ncbi:DEAD/DEAH box helicase [bacterium SCSIO 12741]|nr:DEAD/DEAH box helicase [bacterium SCSIO 12741]